MQQFVSMIQESSVAGEPLCLGYAEAVLGVFPFKMFVSQYQGCQMCMWWKFKLYREGVVMIVFMIIQG